MRKSLLPSKIVRTFGPRLLASCVGCGAIVKPGHCYTGSVVEGLSFFNRSVVSRPRFATDIDVTTQRVAFIKRLRGNLCDECAANYHTMPGGKDGLDRIPLVITDPRPGYIGQSIIPSIEVFRGGCDDRGDTDNSVPHQPPVGPDNHWLNVGRKK